MQCQSKINGQQCCLDSSHHGNHISEWVDQNGLNFRTSWSKEWEKEQKNA